VTFDELGRWLDAYGDAWERLDVDAFVSVFAEDALYYWGPFGEPLHGHDEIRARTAAALSRQTDVHFGHEPLAITPDGRGICRWWVSARPPEEPSTIEEDEGIFLVTFGDDGRCVDFREWWNARTLVDA
jgi:hypothetical protein